MHFSLPNNRPLEQGSHWEESDCNLVHQTPKLPAIISSFLHQTQAYTDSQANLSCNTREKSLVNATFLDEWGYFPSSAYGVPLRWQVCKLWNLQMSRWEATVWFIGTVVCGNKSLRWHGNDMVWGRFLNWVVLKGMHISLLKHPDWMGLLIRGVFDTGRLKHISITAPFSFDYWSSAEKLSEYSGLDVIWAVDIPHQFLLQSNPVFIPLHMGQNPISISQKQTSAIITGWIHISGLYSDE